MAEQIQVGVATTVDEKIHLITRGLDEVMGGEKALASMRAILEKRDLKVSICRSLLVVSCLCPLLLFPSPDV